MLNTHVSAFDLLPLAVTDDVEKVTDISLTEGEDRTAHTFTAGTVSLTLITDLSIWTVISKWRKKYPTKFPMP